MPFYFAALGITLIIFSSLMIVFTKSLNKSKYDIRNYRLPLTGGLSLIKNITFLPFLCIFTAAQKYEVTGNIDVYGANAAIDLPVQYLGSFSIIPGIILILLALVENTFQYQQFLTKSSSSVFSRAHSKIETLKIFLTIALIYSYFYLLKIQNNLHLFIAIVIGTIL